ncbi:MAG TPA: type VI secretion system protein TssA [Urbifossiella sp.]|nr:type VI secretion system protein TssA [Urbifossiella sp.]
MSESGIASIDEFLAEIPGDSPAGVSLPFAIKAELEEARKEIDPNDYDANDPTRPSEPKKADWPAIASLAQRTLKETSKDLLVAARLTEALAKLHGFGGLADGLAIMRGMVDRCWDRMYPEIEDGDIEVRAGPFHWLGDADRGAKFPFAVRNLPILSNNGTPLGWRQWKEGAEGRGSVSKDEFEAAVNRADRAQCQATVDAVTRVISELNGLGELLNKRMGHESPGMSELRGAIGECYSLARQILDKKGPAIAVEEAGGGDGEAGTSGGGSPSDRAVLSRSEVYRRLGEAADLLERLEPHSPIPYLIRKAVELGAMPFPVLMRALIRDDNVLMDMSRELGIKQPEPQG